MVQNIAAYTGVYLPAADLATQKSQVTAYVQEHMTKPKYPCIPHLYPTSRKSVADVLPLSLSSALAEVHRK